MAGCAIDKRTFVLVIGPDVARNDSSDIMFSLCCVLVACAATAKSRRRARALTSLPPADVQELEAVSGISVRQMEESLCIEVSFTPYDAPGAETLGPSIEPAASASAGQAATPQGEVHQDAHVFLVSFSAHYPFTRPVMRWTHLPAGLCHPNLGPDGTVSVDELTDWGPANSIASVMQALFPGRIQLTGIAGIKAKQVRFHAWYTHHYHSCPELGRSMLFCFALRRISVFRPVAQIHGRAARDLR